MEREARAPSAAGMRRRDSTLVIVIAIAVLLGAGWLVFTGRGLRPSVAQPQERWASSPNDSPSQDSLRQPANDRRDLVPMTTESNPASVNRENPSLGAFDAVDQCLQDFESRDAQRTVRCLAALDLSLLSAEQLATWICESDASFHAISLVAQARVTRLEPGFVVPFLQRFQEACPKYRESGLTLSCLQYGKFLSEAWYQDVGTLLEPGIMLTGDGNEAAIQLAEDYVREGDVRLTQFLEDIGRGLYGGTSRQVHRAALIALVNSPSPMARLEYLESVYRSADASGSDLGNLMAEFLANGKCWTDGKPRQALLLLNDVLRDPRFTEGCAAQLEHFADHPPPATDGELWRAVMDYATYVRRLNH